jgi:hypothetical protein
LGTFAKGWKSRAWANHDHHKVFLFAINRFVKRTPLIWPILDDGAASAGCAFQRFDFGQHILRTGVSVVRVVSCVSSPSQNHPQVDQTLDATYTHSIDLLALGTPKSMGLAGYRSILGEGDLAQQLHHLEESAKDISA